MWADMNESDRGVRSLEYLSQYKMNIRDLKLHYKNNLIEVDGSSDTILNDLASLIRFKIESRSKRKYKVLLFGPPGAGKKTITKQLNHKFGFVPISINSLLMDQIDRKTEVGKEIFDCYRTGELVSDEIIYGLLKNRLEKADCRMHGYVLEGFPKNEN
jgi:SpoVK/Ycf46/Vps4 family AAA+-type ATPase